MLGYNDLKKEIAKVVRTGSIETTEEKAIEYQDMIGHSNFEELQEAANDHKGAFYKIYATAYGITETLKFFRQNDYQILQVLQERDTMEYERDNYKEQFETRKADCLKLMDKLDETENENQRLTEENEKMKDEIIRLKARLFDYMNK